ncbi:MAG: glycoside hydrolase family 15 protein [Candidatus Paceibacterota bacterium]
MYQSIKDHSLIGNLRTCALVSQREASIDWLPLPLTSSPSLFSALLDDEKGGYWNFSPADGKRYSVEQFYIKKTNLLVTRFVTDQGVFEVSDLMPPKQGKNDSSFELYREVKCVSGVCRIEMNCEPRFNYCRGVTELEKTSNNSVSLRGEEQQMLLLSDHFHLDAQDHLVRSFLEMKEGECAVFALISDEDNHPEGDALTKKATDLYQEIITYWREWLSSGMDGPGPDLGLYQEAVERSALTLKLLTYQPTGTMVAAPTASLPDEIEGVRNWDYRFNWMRDSSFAFSVLCKLGHCEEVSRHIDWILDTCLNGEDCQPELMKVLYDIEGKIGPEEEFLDHFKGHKNSQPVRIGNAAALQSQKDIYGSVLDMLWNVSELWINDNLRSERIWKLISSFADLVVSCWQEPGQGVWEFRMEPRHYVYSKVMCWVALDRAVRTAERYGFEGNVERWKDEKDVIKKEVMEKGWSEKKDSFVQYFGSEDMDASLLTLSSVGFIEGDDEKMLKTIAAIKRELGVGKELLLRYKVDDGLSGSDGAFLITSFWLVDALVLAGKEKEATDMFENLLKLRNHTGLLSEQIDPKSGDLLGNFPQAYSHIGLIKSALLIKGFRFY